MTPESDNFAVSSPHSSYRRISYLALIIAAILYGLFFIPWLILTGMLLLSFSPPDAPFTYLMACSYPLFSIGSLVAGFILFRKNQFRPVLVIVLFPIINICLYLISFALIWP